MKTFKWKIISDSYNKIITAANVINIMLKLVLPPGLLSISLVDVDGLKFEDSVKISKLDPKSFENRWKNQEVALR